MKFNPYEQDNILLSRERDFMDMVTSMEENGVNHPIELTEFEFYSKIAYYQKKYQKLMSKS